MENVTLLNNFSFSFLILDPNKILIDNQMMTQNSNSRFVIPSRNYLVFFWECW